MKKLFFFVILLTLLSSCGSVSAPSQTTRVTYELRVGGVRHYTMDALQPGDVIFNEPLDITLGTIQAIRFEPCEGQYAFPDGSVRSAEIDDRYNVFLTVTADMTSDGYGGYKIEDYLFTLNQNNTFWTKYCTFTGQVVAMGESDS